MTLSRSQATESLRRFVRHRDAMLHEDANVFQHNLQRFIEFLDDDPLAKPILLENPNNHPLDVEGWWQQARSSGDRSSPKLIFPTEPNDEFFLQAAILRYALQHSQWLRNFGFAMGRSKVTEGTELFRILVAAPFADELLTDEKRMSPHVTMISPEIRPIYDSQMAAISGENHATCAFWFRIFKIGCSKYSDGQFLRLLPFVVRERL